MMEGKAVAVENKNPCSGGGRPRREAKNVRHTSLAYRLVKIRAMTTMEVTEGMKNPARNHPWRGIFWLTRTAVNRASAVVKGIVPTTKKLVFFSAVQKSGSD